jgi:hypothetical protein
MEDLGLEDNSLQAAVPTMIPLQMVLLLMSLIQ